MVKASYVPERGDIVWVSFDPRLGHEQGGTRPAIVLSRRVYNEPSSLALVCPITSQRKGYPFEVVLAANLAVTGVVLCDQLRTLDWRARRFRFACSAPPPTVAAVAQRASLLVA
jgi:mRNA interferase MazF